MSTPSQVREQLLQALDADFIGPFSGENETLPLAPSRWYLTGFLVPQAAREPDDPTADEGIGAGEDDEEDGEGTSEPEPKRKNLLPASMGLSVLLPTDGVATVDATISWADYRVVPTEETESGKALAGVTMHQWERVSRSPVTVTVPVDPAKLRDGIEVPGSNGLFLVGHVETVGGVRAFALFVVNRREPGAKGRLDEAFAFQVKLAIRCETGLLPRPDLARDASEWDEWLADLQYRDRREYAVGHGVAATAIAESGTMTTAVTTWIPRAEVPRVVTREIPALTSAMEDLAALADGAAARKALLPIVEEYGRWIEAVAKVDVGTQRRKDTQAVLVQRATKARDRVAEGIALLEKDPQVLEAFRLANAAMAEAARHRSPGRYEDGKSRPAWFAFQLAFVLLNLPSIADPAHADRETVELIFFPTGGGKTEAYLGVIAVTLLLRRLRGAERKDKGLGVAVLLRYTLRLLTLDQLSRAATLICALELRRAKDARLGPERFAVGLWVGRTATANTLEDAARRINDWKIKRGLPPFPLSHCPWCRHEIEPASLEVRPTITQPHEVIVGCTNFRCEFSAGKRKEGLPVLFVDEQIYRELPCFLLATVDKFAMLPWRGETSALFGRVRARQGREFHSWVETRSLPPAAEALPDGLRPPELIVQDELHLISGPLGTMVGLYETAVETLASREVNGKRIVPKILASTATVRRANEQTQALFGRRKLSMFPPPGIDESETFFAMVAKDLPGRLYAGVAANGRAMKAILLRTYVALLSAAKCASTGGKNDPADPYLTLAGYFNSLRELGGMRRLVDDEVRSRLGTQAERVPVGFSGPHPFFANRDIGEPLELTSRESTAAITNAKAKLAREYADPEHADVLLASNMISVGVDIDRLGLMVIAGQPKSASEYIQASSRVGREPKKPGLVVTVFNLHKPRDRSHYERFEAFHHSFYRFVEATSVTPFSGPALERGLAGLLVAISRLGDPQLTPPLAVSEIENRRASAEEAVSAIARRAGIEGSSATAGEQERIVATMEARGRNLLDAWTQVVRRVKDAASQACYSRFDVEHPGKPLLFQVLDPTERDSDAEKFAAPTSMRDVEESVHLWLERRQLEKPEEEADG